MTPDYCIHQCPHISEHACKANLCTAPMIADPPSRIIAFRVKPRPKDSRPQRQPEVIS